MTLFPPAGIHTPQVGIANEGAPGIGCLFFAVLSLTANLFRTRIRKLFAAAGWASDGCHSMIAMPFSLHFPPEMVCSRSDHG